MKTRARTIISLLCASFLFAAFCPLSQAGARQAKSESPEAPETAPVKKKTPPKKKKPKKVKAESEYKFTATDATPSYRFDKNGDPILKRGKYAKAAKSENKKSRAPENGKAASQSAIPRMKAAVKAGAAARYVCPMGDYEGDKPGQCPKCGMTLVEKK
jgi:hypothetical protein